MSKGNRSKTVTTILSAALGVNLLLPLVPVSVDAAKNPVKSEVQAELFEYNLKNYKTGKLMVHEPRVSIALDDSSDIKNGIVFTGNYAEFTGNGYMDTKVTIKPKKSGTVIDFKGTVMSEVTIEGDKVKEIRGSENIEDLNYAKGANPDKITFPKEENFKLSIMHTNDTHANLNDVAKRVTAVKEVRVEKPNALLLDAGDVMSGTLYFNEFQGQADLKFMNLMGYDAMTFGNHEFDLGSSEEGLQALKDFVAGANFPFVSANVDFSQDDKFTGLFSDLISSEPENGNIYNGIVKEIDGEEVGIFGLTTEETANLASPGAITFEDYKEEAEKAVAAFEGQGVDKIVAITHIGYDDNPAVDNDLTLASEVEGIDVIVGGHSHTELEEPVVIDKDENGAVKDPTVIVQTGANNSNLGVVDVEFDDNGVIVEQAGELISIGDQAEDPQAAALLEEYSTVVDGLAEEEIGVTAEVALENPRTGDEGNTTGESVRKNETVLGNLITDGMLSKAKEYDENVIMALQNGGGIRAAIDAGPITVGEVITVLPFGNTLATMDVTGAELKEAFEISFGQYPLESGGFLHAAGAKVEFDSSKPAGERVVSIAYENADGTFTDIEDSETYTVATNAFTAKGGDGYTVFAKAYEEGRVTDLGLSDWENFRDHLVSLGTIPTEIEGRIVDVEGEEPTPDPEELPGGDVAASEFSGTEEETKVYSGDVTVNTTDVTKFENVVIKGNLIFTGKLEEGTTFNNIKVEGNLDIFGIITDDYQIEGVEVTGETIL
ncbi:bifunctional metallophosphatase/5'-nucleotidase [Oceanobacillus rekensis]|uniref:bifunctional metallophosphatase/5'-nucleotidase n=1 Tax=Oceanobacillus rekensis TaxID=937927 RepID=UPI001FE87245|nr:5'-nucleotidase C-terminal domain-containing protein [Oceanobacillus rekensis]